MGSPISYEAERTLQLKDFQDSIVDKNFANLTIEVVPTPYGGYTEVIADRNSNIRHGVMFGEEAGPVGADTTIEEGAVILGALHRKIHIGKNVEVGRKARLGSFANQIGKITIEEEAKIGATVRIFSPKARSTTIIGAGATVGRGSIIGHDAKTIPGKNSMRAAQGKGVKIGENSILGNRTIVEPGVAIGNKVEVGGGYVLASGLVIPDGVKIYENFEAQNIKITQEWLDKYLAQPVLH